MMLLNQCCQQVESFNHNILKDNLVKISIFTAKTSRTRTFRQQHHSQMSVNSLLFIKWVKDTAAFFIIKYVWGGWVQTSALYTPPLIWSALINQLIFLSQGLFINLIINKSRHSISRQILIANFVITVSLSMLFFCSL